MNTLDPNQYSLEDYTNKLIQLNKNRVLLTQERLEKFEFTTTVSSSIVRILGGQTEDLKLYPMLVGSDGRLEKGAKSPDDLMIYIAGSRLPHKLLKPLSGWLTSEFPKGRDHNLEQVEPKLLDLSLIYFYEDTQNPRPGRILDAREVNPEDADVTELTKNRLYSELMRSPEGTPVLTSVTKKESERRISAKKLVNRGVQNVRGESLVHVDYLAGTAFFDPKRDEGVFAVSSFKQGFLRLMQLELLQASLIHLGVKEENEARAFIRHLPSNTLERIDYLVDWNVFNKRIFSTERITELKNNYAYFVQQYHRSEYAYVKSGETAINFNKAEVENRKKDILAFDAALGKQFSKIDRIAP